MNFGEVERSDSAGAGLVFFVGDGVVMGGVVAMVIATGSEVVAILVAAR